MACVTHEIYVKNMSLNMNGEQEGGCVLDF